MLRIFKNNFFLFIFRNELIQNFLVRMNDIRNNYVKGMQLYAAKQYNSAIEIFTKCINADETNSQYYTKRADCFQAIKQFRMARKDYKSAIQFNKSEFYNFFQLSIVYGHLNKVFDQFLLMLHAKSVLPAHISIEKEYNHALIHFLEEYIDKVFSKPNIVRCLRSLKAIGMENTALNMEKISLIQQKVRTNGTFDREEYTILSLVVINYLANFEINNKNEKFSVKLMNRSNGDILGDGIKEYLVKLAEPKDRQRNAVIQKEKGNEAYKQGNFEEALHYYENAIELEPTNILFYTNKALALSKLNKHNKAIETIQIAIEVARDTNSSNEMFAKIYEKLNFIYHSKNDEENACKALEKSLQYKREPSLQDRYLKELLKLNQGIHYNAGLNYLRDRNTKDALNEFSIEIGNDPDNLEFKYQKAVCLKEIGLYHSACDEADEIIEKNREHAFAYYLKRDCYYAQHDMFKAYYNHKIGQGLYLCNNDDFKKKLNIYKEALKNHALSKDKIKQALSNPDIASILNDEKMVYTLLDLKSMTKEAEKQLPREVRTKIKHLRYSGLISFR